MMRTEDIAMLGGLAVVIYLLTRPAQAAAQQAQVVVQQAQAASSCPGCSPYLDRSSEVSQAGALAANSPGETTQQPSSSVLVPQWYTDTLGSFTAQIDSLSAAGNWEAVWQAAAQRDAWIASLGMLPTQWEAFV